MKTHLKRSLSPTVFFIVLFIFLLSLAPVMADTFWDGSLGGNIHNENSGNVGVGTSNPLYNLEVQGTTPRIAIDAASGNPSFRWVENGTAKWYAIYNTVSHYLGFVEVGKATHLTIQDITGNIGIQNTDPKYRLDVVGDIASRRTMGFPSVYTGTPLYGVYLVQPASNELAFFTNSSERMRIDDSGKLGINTTDPSYRLDVVGAAQIAGTLRLAPGDGRLMTIVQNEYQEGGAVINTNSELNFQVDGLTRLEVHSDRIVVNDVYDPGGKNLQIGNNSFLTDVDLNNTLGIYGNQDSSTGKIRLGSGGATIEGKSNGDICIGSCD